MQSGSPHAHLWIFDVSDLANIRPLATFQMSEIDSPWSRAGGRFGTHQFQEHVEDTRVYLAWFSGREGERARGQLPEEDP